MDSEDLKAEEQRILHRDSFSNEARNPDIENPQYASTKADDDTSKLGLRATAKLSLEFCLLWVCTIMDIKVQIHPLTSCSLSYVILMELVLFGKQNISAHFYLGELLRYGMSPVHNSR